MRFYCTSTGPIGGLNCEVILYFNWSHWWSNNILLYLCTTCINVCDVAKCVCFDQITVDPQLSGPLWSQQISRCPDK